MNNYNNYSNQCLSTSDILNGLGKRFREYRIRNRLTQKEAAEKAGVSVSTVHKFEAGRLDNMSFSTFVGLLRSLGAADDLNKILPELPENPFAYRNFDKGVKKKRIRHAKTDKK